MSITLKPSLLLINEVYHMVKYHMVEVYKIQHLWEKNVCQSFSEKPRRKLSQNRKKYNKS